MENFIYGFHNRVFCAEMGWNISLKLVSDKEEIAMNSSTTYNPEMRITVAMMYY